MIDTASLLQVPQERHGWRPVPLRERDRRVPERSWQELHRVRRSQAQPRWISQRNRIWSETPPPSPWRPRRRTETSISLQCDEHWQELHSSSWFFGYCEKMEDPIYEFRQKGGGRPWGLYGVDALGRIEMCRDQRCCLLLWLFRCRLRLVLGSLLSIWLKWNIHM